MTLQMFYAFNNKAFSQLIAHSRKKIKVRNELANIADNMGVEVMNALQHFLANPLAALHFW